MKRVILPVFAIALLGAFSTSLRADPVYVGGQNLDVHSWQSGLFYDTPGGTFDHIQFQIDTGSTTAFNNNSSNSPETFEMPSASYLSDGWTVNTVDSNSNWLIANYSPGQASTFQFNFVFDDPQPPFVGIFYQLFSGDTAIESGYFYTPDSAIVPNGFGVGYGWGWSQDSSVISNSARIDAPVQPTPEPAGIVALLSLGGMGLIGLVWRRRR